MHSLQEHRGCEASNGAPSAPQQAAHHDGSFGRHEHPEQHAAMSCCAHPPAEPCCTSDSGACCGGEAQPCSTPCCPSAQLPELPACSHGGGPAGHQQACSTSCSHQHHHQQHAPCSTQQQACCATAHPAPSVIPSAAGGAAAAMTAIHAAGICCPMESKVIHSLLDKLPGVQHVNVAIVTKTVHVTHDPAGTPAAAMVAALNGAGLQARLVSSRGGGAGAAGGPANPGCCGASHDPLQPPRPDEAGWDAAPARPAWLPPWPMLACGALVLVSLVSLAPQLPAPAAAALRACGAAAGLVGCPPVVRKAWGAARAGTLDINALVLIALAGALALGQWLEAGSIMLLFTLSEWLEDKCVGRAGAALAAIAQLQPDVALLLRPAQAAGKACEHGCCGGNAEGALPVKQQQAQQHATGGSGLGPLGARPVAAATLLPGDVVLVRPGDKLPADGRLLESEGLLDESMVTGESRPVVKAPGGAVLGGTINVGSAALTVEVSAAAADSAVARLAALVEAAAASKSRRDRAVEAFARWYTPAMVLVTAALLGALLVLSPTRWREWLYLSLVLLVTSCPCALVISTPVASAAGLARAAGAGVLVKGGRFLELLGQVRHISFDKSGTLTEGSYQLLHIEHFTAPPGAPSATDRWAPGDPLRWAAALEAHSTHPLAPAIIASAQEAAMTGAGPIPLARDVQVITGRGVSGRVEGRAVAVGNLAWAQELLAGGSSGSATAVMPAKLQQQHQLPSAAQQQLAAAGELAELWGQRHGASAVGVLVEGALVALLLLADRPREEAAEALAQLRAMGVEVSMLTGDGMGPAACVAEQLGVPIERVYAQLLPQDKLELLGSLRTRGGGSGGGATMHVGDGVNDAPALAAADVGAAMGVAGAALAVEAADVALFTNDLRTLPFALRLGRAVGRNVATNIGVAVGAKLIVLAAAAAGHASLWLSLAADVGASLAVTLHALTLLGFERRWSGGSEGGGVLGAVAGSLGLPVYSQLGDLEAGSCGSGAVCLVSQRQRMLAVPGSPAAAKGSPRAAAPPRPGERLRLLAQHPGADGSSPRSPAAKFVLDDED